MPRTFRHLQFDECRQSRAVRKRGASGRDIATRAIPAPPAISISGPSNLLNSTATSPSPARASSSQRSGASSVTGSSATRASSRWLVT